MVNFLELHSSEGEMHEFMELLSDLHDSESIYDIETPKFVATSSVVYDVVPIQPILQIKRKAEVVELLGDENADEDFEESASVASPIVESGDSATDSLILSASDEQSLSTASSSGITPLAAKAHALIQNKPQAVVAPQKQPKRRHRFRPRVSPFPRILKRDIRRDISPMLINCLNSADPRIIGGFFYTFCVPNCKLQDTLCKANVLLKELNGVDSIASMLGGGIADVPDFVCRIRETQIKQHLYESGSKIVMKLCSQGTQLMSYFATTMGGDATKSVTSVIHEKLQKNPRLQMLLGNGNAQDGSDAVKLNTQLLDASHALPPEIAQHIFSVEIRIYTTATLYLDDNHRIFFMDMREDFEAV